MLKSKPAVVILAVTLGAFGVLTGLRPALPAAADTLGRGAASGAAVAWFNWVDHASPGMNNDNIHLLNPGSSVANGSISVSGVWSAQFSVPAGGETYVVVPYGVIGGPAVVQVASGPGVIASQRVQYWNSFSEVPAATAAQALTSGWFSWYDRASPGMTNDNIHVINPGSTTASGLFTLAGSNQMSFSVPPGGERYYAFPFGTINGPLRFDVNSGPGVIVSQRVQYQSSFNEMLAMDPGHSAKTLYFAWFDRASPGVLVDDIHVVNPGPDVAGGTVSGPGLGAQPFSLGPGDQQYFGWSGIGGPVRIDVTSGTGVLASQRLSWPPDFSEWPAMTSTDASSDTWFSWYDHASPGFADDIHVTNPGASPATVSMTVQGVPAATLTVAAGTDGYYSFPPGTIGGPLRVQVTSGPPVLAVQRTFIHVVTSRTLPVPEYHQRYALSCEEASLRMALAYEGINVTEEQIFSTMGIDYRQAYTDASGFHWGDPYAQFVGDPNGSEINHTGYGSYNEAVARTAGSLGGQPIASGEQVSPQQIYQSVLDGHPAIAWVSFDWTPHPTSTYFAFDGRPIRFGAPYEHAVVIIGVDGDQLLVNNPWSGQQWISKGTFESAYSMFNDMAVILN